MRILPLFSGLYWQPPITSVILCVMRLSRLLPIAALVLMAINATGVLRAVHMLSEHAPTALHSTHDGHEGHGHSAPGDDQPSPTPSDDHDCDLCFSFRSMHEIIPQTPIMVVRLDLVSPTIPQLVTVIRAHARPAANPARGPPAC